MNRFIIILVIFCFSNCQNYESEKYIKIENEAIKDIILEITKFKEMNELNNWKNKKNKLYLISKLDTITAWISKPTGYYIGADGTYYSEEKIEKNKKEFELNLEKYEKEERLFSNFKNGKIKSRNLKSSFENLKLKIELIKTEKIQKLKSFETNENEFGYLSISRIDFNRDFTKGYLHFNFICGIGCAWNSNIEIKKVNGKWKITEYFSGGVA